MSFPKGFIMKIRPLHIKHIASLLLAAALMLSSCKSLEVSEIPERTVSNGNFGGIAFDTTAKTAETALPIPQKTNALQSEETEISGESTTTPPQTTAAESETGTTAVTTTQNPVTTTAATKATTTKAATTAATTKPAETTAKTTEKTTTAATTEKTTAVTTTTTAEIITTAPKTEEETTKAPASGRNYPKNSYSALNYSEVKGVWISYIEINNLLKGKSKSEFRKAAGKLYDNCLSLGLNTVYVHVRAYGDAFYYSELYPFSKYVSGSLGTKTDYDPLEILIEEAHDRGLSFQAWINPLRLCASGDMPYVSADYPIGSWYKSADYKGKYIVNVNGTWYLNPAYSEAIKLVGDGVREIVSGYDVDGIHIDDYFYPTTDASFDSAAFNNSGKASLSAFRIANCNNLVREIYNATHECSSTAVFGASTQGNMNNNITQLYADAESWCRGGYIDYFAPQIYYGFENSAQPFKTCVDSWCDLVKGTNVKLYIGLALYKIGQEDKWAGSGQYEWQNTSTMIKRQIEYSFGKKDCSGIVLYCYNYLFSDGYHTAAIQKEIDNFKDLLI